MPLALESVSHGTIAFGFFNIESDMLLCDRYFFFADDFCTNIVDIAKNVRDRIYQTVWKDEIRPAYVLALKKQILLNPAGLFEHIEFSDYRMLFLKSPGFRNLMVEIYS